MKKTRSPKSNTDRSRKMIDDIKSNGGAAVLVRLKTKAEVDQLDALVQAVPKSDRSKIIRSLIEEKFKAMQMHQEMAD